MMKYFLSVVLLVSGIAVAQTAKPKIGSDQGVKEFFEKIKKGLPDIKKNLTRKSGNDYSPKLNVGSGGFYTETNGDQSLTYTYFSTGYSGTLTDYQDYYKRLISIAQEVFGKDYTATSSERGNVWRTAFYEKGGNVYTSTTGIYIKCDGTFEATPTITIEITSKGK